MLTKGQLAEIKQRLPTREGSCAYDIAALLDALAAKDAVLSQFADSANWQYEAPAEDESFPLWAWAGDANPVHLATQALGEGK